MMNICLLLQLILDELGIKENKKDHNLHRLIIKIRTRSLL